MASLSSVIVNCLFLRLIRMVNRTIVTDPTIRQPGFDIPRHAWSLVSRFRTGQGPCRANLHKWGLAQSPSCDCGQRQTFFEIHCMDSPDCLLLFLSISVYYF